MCVRAAACSRVGPNTDGVCEPHHMFAVPGFPPPHSIVAEVKRLHRLEIPTVRRHRQRDDGREGKACANRVQGASEAARRARHAQKEDKSHLDEYEHHLRHAYVCMHMVASMRMSTSTSMGYADTVCAIGELNKGRRPPRASPQWFRRQPQACPHSQAARRVG